MRTCTHVRVAHAFRPALVELRVPLQLPKPEVDNLQSACLRPAETSSTRSRAVECSSAFASVSSFRSVSSSTRKSSLLRVRRACPSSHSTCACPVDIGMRIRARDRDFERRAAIRTSEGLPRLSTDATGSPLLRKCTNQSESESVGALEAKSASFLMGFLLLPLIALMLSLWTSNRKSA